MGTGEDKKVDFVRIPEERPLGDVWPFPPPRYEPDWRNVNPPPRQEIRPPEGAHRKTFAGVIPRKREGGLNRAIGGVSQHSNQDGCDVH